MPAGATILERARALAAAGERLSRPIAMLLSLALLLVVFREASSANWDMLRQGGHLGFAFWLALAAYYLLAPAAEWYLYSRLWRNDRLLLPALLRKFVYNELLLDYLGDVQFVAWARSRFAERRPLAGVKDVMILSALTGNIVTIVLIVLAWPLVRQGLAGVPLGTIFKSLAAVAVISTLILAFSRRIFSHPRGTLWWMAAVLVGRAVLATLLSAVLWHLLMPDLPLSGLFLLATLRMMVSRLPLVPSKDLLFAGLAVLVFGRSGDISGATSMIASLMVAIHLFVGLVLVLTQFKPWAYRRS